MKKTWTEPKLLNLSVSKTYTEENDTFSSWGKHSCHRESYIHNGNCSSGIGHTPNAVGSCTEHLTGLPGAPAYSCCCHSLTPSIS